MQVNIALLTVTDTRTIDTDKSGAILVKKIEEQNHKLVDRKIVKDEKEAEYIADSQIANPQFSEVWKEDSGEIEDQTITIEEVVWNSEKKDWVNK